MAPRPALSATVSGFSEPEPVPFNPSAGERDRTAWLLACAVADLRATATNPSPEGAGVSPLATLQQAARLFADLQSRPYAAVTDILLHPAVAQAPLKEARRIETLIEALTQTPER
jgi:hypothetical protein